MKGSKSARDTEKDAAKRALTVEKFKIMKKIISNEKKAQELLKNRLSEMETSFYKDRDNYKKQ